MGVPLHRRNWQAPRDGFRRRHQGERGSDRQTLTDARELASEARKVLQRGADPIDERDRQRDDSKTAATAKKADKARERLTLARVAREYHERVVMPQRTPKHAAAWIASLEHQIPEELWHKPIADIEPPQLLTALAGVRALADADVRVPETLSRVRQRLDAVFEDAIFHKRCTANPAAAIRRKMRETLPSKKAGEFAALPYRELPRFMPELRQAQGTAARCLEFAALTASRTNEVLQAEWSEFDLEAGTWVIPAERMKAGEPHTVFLSEQAIEVVRAHIGLDTTLLFPSVMLPGKPMSNMAMLTALGRLGYRDRTTVHGLCRASFSTWANETGAARPDVIEACLAHREADRVKAAYNRAKFSDERRALMAAWGASLTKAPVSNVVPIAA